MTLRSVVTDYVAWKGRYCAFDYDQFEHFLNYVFAQTMQKTMLPQPDPWEGSTNADGIGKIWSKLIFVTYTEVIASRQRNVRTYVNIYAEVHVTWCSGTLQLKTKRNLFRCNDKHASASERHAAPTSERLALAHHPHEQRLVTTAVRQATLHQNLQAERRRQEDHGRHAALLGLAQRHESIRSETHQSRRQAQGIGKKNTEPVLEHGTRTTLLLGCKIRVVISTVLFPVC